jgi:hypothetical protein
LPAVASGKADGGRELGRCAKMAASRQKSAHSQIPVQISPRASRTALFFEDREGGRKKTAKSATGSTMPPDGRKFVDARYLWESDDTAVSKTDALFALA